MSTQTSAALAEAERTIKKLNDENEKMRRELHETKTLYAQLVQESERESFDERRVLILKSQLIQMERQLLVMNEAMSSRCTVQMEMENAMLDMANICRKYICVDNKSATVEIPRSVLMNLVESAESVRLKLARTIENCSKEKLQKPLSVMNGFVKKENVDAYSLFDVCYGKTGHLNLKQVGKLESELCDLYQCLCSAENVMSKLLVQKWNHDTNAHLSRAALERQYAITQTALDKLRSCCDELLNLSILIPAAPIPAFKSKLKGITSDKILCSLPTSVKNKQETKQVIDALMKSLNFAIHMKNLEISALKDELAFHQGVYELQCQYMDDLFKSMKDGYGEFEKSAMEYLVSPLDEIFGRYETLKSDASEEALRDFLMVFKENADDLKSAVDKMKPVSHEERAEAVSAFGEEFFANLLELQNNCSQKRDEFVSELEIVKQQKEEYAEVLEILLKNSQETKLNGNSAKLEYDKIMLDDSRNDSVCGSDDDSMRAEPKRIINRKREITQPKTTACEGCNTDSGEPQVTNQLPQPEIFPKSKSSLRNTPPESRIPRTPISGSSFPRTPMTPSSTNAASRRAATNNRSSLPALTPSSRPSSSSATGLPSRSLKLKK